MSPRSRQGLNEELNGWQQFGNSSQPHRELSVQSKQDTYKYIYTSYSSCFASMPSVMTLGPRLPLFYFQ